MKYALKRSIELLRRDGLLGLCKGIVRYLRWGYPFPEIKLRYLYNRCKYGPSVADPFKIIHIDPSTITHTTDEFAMFYDVGTIQGGDWDKRVEPVENNFKYEAVWEHFENNVPWEDTGLFSEYSSILQEDGQADSYTSISELKDRYEKIDAIFEDIRSNGFKSPSEINSGDISKKEQYDYPAVHITREGEIVFADGWHRFTIARVLELDEIPVRIIARHKIWQSIREKFYNDKSADKYKEHPDLDDLE